MSTVNWSELITEAETSGNLVPVPPGEYDCVVETAQNVTSQSGKVMFKAKFRVIAGPHATRTIYNNFTVSPESAGALKFFFQHMAIFGLDKNFFAQNPDPSYVAQMLVGKQCKLKIEHRQWNGQTQEDVKAVMPVTPGIVAQAAGAVQPQMPQPMTPAPMQPAPQPMPFPQQPAAQPMAPQPMPAPQPQYVLPPAQPVAPQPPMQPAPVAPVAPQPGFPAVPPEQQYAPQPGQPMQPAPTPAMPPAPVAPAF